jgi:hypothetical protein
MRRDTVASSQDEKEKVVTMTMQELTCKNHPACRYLVKVTPDGWPHRLHLVASDPEVVLEHLKETSPRRYNKLKDLPKALLTEYPIECKCPASDLIVLREAD